MCNLMKELKEKQKKKPKKPPGEGERSVCFFITILMLVGCSLGGGKAGCIYMISFLKRKNKESRSRHKWRVLGIFIFFESVWGGGWFLSSDLWRRMQSAICNLQPKSLYVLIISFLSFLLHPFSSLRAEGETTSVEGVGTSAYRICLHISVRRPQYAVELRKNFLRSKLGDFIRSFGRPNLFFPLSSSLPIG